MGADLRGFRPIEQWLAQKKPDVLVFIYNDHVTSFFFDHYSAFALGIGERTPSPTKAAARARCHRCRVILRWRSTSAPASWPTNSTWRSSRTARSTMAAFRRCR